MINNSVFYFYFLLSLSSCAGSVFILFEKKKFFIKVIKNLNRQKNVFGSRCYPMQFPAATAAPVAVKIIIYKKIIDVKNNMIKSQNNHSISEADLHFEYLKKIIMVKIIKLRFNIQSQGDFMYRNNMVF